MIKRDLQIKIQESLKDFPVVGILGSRQVGKTTLAKNLQYNLERKSLYLDLELPSDLNKLEEAELYLRQYSDSLIIIDEIQRMPSLFPLLRALVDQNRINGRFLILGSASPDLIKKSSETLAGRIIYHELTPFSINEVGIDKSIIQKLWLRGGYPDSYLAESNEKSFIWREAFIKTYLERDIPQLGLKVPSLQLKRFWTMIAHSHGQIWNASQISNSLGVSSPTIRHYLDILEETFIIRAQAPYYHNIKKRLIKSPKVYIRDSGLLHTFLGKSTIDELQGHPCIGNSWEGFVIEQIMSIIPENWSTYFYRTSAGAEIDLLLVPKNKKPIAIEIKYSASPKVSKGFWNIFEDTSCEKGFVVYPGEEIYPLSKNVFATPIEKIFKIIE